MILTDQSKTSAEIIRPIYQKKEKLEKGSFAMSKGNNQLSRYCIL